MEGKYNVLLNYAGDGEFKQPMATFSFYSLQENSSSTRLNAGRSRFGRSNSIAFLTASLRIHDIHAIISPHRTIDTVASAVPFTMSPFENGVIMSILENTADITTSTVSRHAFAHVMNLICS